MPQIMTVTGPVAPEDLGFCQPHEHLIIDLWRGARGRWDRDGILDDEGIMTKELRDYRNAGGSTIVDLSLPAIGRDPQGLVRLAEAAGVAIVMGCGWYREPYYPADIDVRSTRELVGELIQDIRGTTTDGVYPGIIGEIGSDKSYVSALEERVFRAVGMAQVETGLAVTTHSVGGDVGLRHLEILDSVGVPAERIIIGHCDSTLRYSYLAAILDAGAYVQFDNIGYPLPYVACLEEDLIKIILRLCGEGWSKKLLLSQDICKRSHLKKFGGPGYTYLLETFQKRLMAEGLREEWWTDMTVRNPAAVLAV